MGREFEEHGELVVPATPEQVWDAIATGPGLDGWFMGRTAVRPGPGGSIRTDLGGYAQDFTVTAWEPAERLAIRTPTGDDGSFFALEWLIEGRDGAATVVRSVAHGFIGKADWEDEYEAMTSGGAMYAHTLVEYLTHFRGRAHACCSCSSRSRAAARRCGRGSGPSSASPARLRSGTPSTSPRRGSPA